MWKLSSGLRSGLVEYDAKAIHAVAADTISCGDGDGTGGRDTINDTGSGLGGFTAKDVITILGGTNDGVNGRILSVAAGTLELPAGTLAAEASGSQRIIVTCAGGSWAGVFKNYVIGLFDGTQPASADDTEAGSLLALLTLNGGAFVAGQPGNGLNFALSATGKLGIAVDPVTGLTEVVRGTGLKDGTASWFRIYDNSYTTGADTTSARMDGTVGSQMLLSTVNIKTGVPVGLTAIDLTMPAYKS